MSQLKLTLTRDPRLSPSVKTPIKKKPSEEMEGSVAPSMAVADLVGGAKAPKPTLTQTHLFAKVSSSVPLQEQKETASIYKQAALHQATHKTQIKSKVSIVKTSAAPLVTAPLVKTGPASLVKTGPAPLVKTGPAPLVKTGPAPLVKTSTAPLMKTSAAPLVKTSAAPLMKTGPAPLVKTSAAPLMKTSAAPLMKTSAAPLMKTSAAPLMKTSAAPLMKTGPPPLMKTSAAPLMKTAPAPLMKTSAAPLMKTGPGPLMKTSAAPLMKTGPGPLMKTSAAPLMKTSAAPLMKTSAAPLMKTSAAPLMKTSAAPLMKTGPGPLMKTSAAPLMKTGLGPTPPLMSTLIKTGKPKAPQTSIAPVITSSLITANSILLLANSALASTKQSEEDLSAPKAKKPKVMKTAALPMSRVKTIMKTNIQSSQPSLQLSQDSVLVISKATELFISELSQEAKKAGTSADRKPEIGYSHLAQSVQASDKFQFLKDILPKKVLAKDYLQTQTNIQTNI